MRVIKSFLCIVFFLLLIQIRVICQVNYYVDPSGTDDVSHGSASGTDAWATIQYAVDNVANPTTETIIINLSADTYTLNSNEVLFDRDFTDLTLKGAGADLTIVQGETTSNSATDNIFTVNGDNFVTIRDMCVRYGGGLDGAIFGKSSSNVTLINLFITSNHSSYEGGGIEAWADITIINCTISNNSCERRGAGICFYGYASRTLTLTNSTITGNTTTNSNYGEGAGIFSDGSTIITNCTITNNSALNDVGGGYYNVYYNLYIKNTVIANNTGNGSPDDFYFSSGTIYDNGYNIVEYSTGYSFEATGDITGNQLNLNISSTLEDNNTTNEVPTLKLTSGSVAINAGEGSIANNGITIPSQDQRGAERNSTIDIGAYEYWDDAGALPVEINTFAANISGNKILLIWETVTELNNYGFEIERKLLCLNNIINEWEVIGFIAGHGNCSSPRSYEIIDENPPKGNLEYRLKQIDADGTYEYYNTTVNVDNTVMELHAGSHPFSFDLMQNYPNPFNPTTRISFSLAQEGEVEIDLFNSLGEYAAKIFEGYYPPGIHAVIFNGSDLPSGIYYCRLRADSFSKVIKMALIE